MFCYPHYKKKGDEVHCNNHKQISLLNREYTVFSLILIKRLKLYENKK